MRFRRAYDPASDGTASGAAPVVEPSEISGIQGWWRADLGVVGNPVDTWTDQINGYVVQGTGTARPSVGAVAALNNQQAITFDGVNDELICTQPNSTFAFLHRLYTYLAVVQSRQAAGTGALFSTGGLTTSRPGKYLTLTNTGTLNSAVSNSSTSFILSYQQFSQPLINVSAAFLESADQAATPDSALQVNAVLNLTLNFTATPTVANSFAPLRFGNRPTTSAFLLGDIAEMAFWNRALTTAEKAQMKAYVLDRYAITIP